MEIIAVPKMRGDDSDEPNIVVELTHIGRDPFQRQLWAYMVVSDGLAMVDRADIYSYRLTPPRRMARTVVGTLASVGESLALWQQGYYGDGESDYASRYTAREQQFLIANYERFYAAERSMI